MAAGPNIVLTATAISFTNEWWQTDEPNFRIVAAGLVFSLIDAAIDHVSPVVASGLGTIMLITVLLTPFNGSSPIQTLSDLAISRPKGK